MIHRTAPSTRGEGVAFEMSWMVAIAMSCVVTSLASWQTAQVLELAFIMRYPVDLSRSSGGS